MTAIFDSSDASVAKANVDGREVAYYEQLASTWWDRRGPFWPLHRLNELRSGFLSDVLCRAFARCPYESQPLRGIRILDVGCGGGMLSESMARLGAKVHGIDVVDKNVQIATTHVAGSGLQVRYETTSAVALARRGVQFDAVLNMEVLEHVPDAAALVADCARLVRPGGVLVLATINRNLLSWLFAIVGAEYVLRWLPRGTHRWRRFVKPDELTRFVTEAGLEVRERIGVRVNPVTRHFALTHWLAVNYMLVAQRPCGEPRLYKPLTAGQERTPEGCDDKGVRA
jgi:2-polyprenyl-6-hydroxyphenyl methylase/3-demethylubiquinone-9 3-methyltransferase